MNDDELENIKDNLKNVEFNNEEEDNEIIAEESKINKEEKSNNDKNKIIIICCIIIGILLIVIILMSGIFSGNKDNEENNKEPDSDHVTEIEPEKAEEKTDIKTSSSVFLSDKYLYVIDNNKKYITDLDGNIVLKLDEKSEMINGKIKYILLKENKGNDTKYLIKKIDNDRVIDVISETLSGTNNLIYDENNNLIGVYNNNNKNETLYLIDNNVSKEIIFNNQSLYSPKNNETKIIYGGRYGIISKNSLYGLYDLKDNKSLVETKYQNIKFLNDDIFAASRTNLFGIIDKNDKELLEFEYNDISYSNGLYFVIKDETAHIFTSDFKDTGNTIELEINGYVLTPFKDKVIVKKSINNNYAVIDKTGKVTEYDFNNFVIYNNYLVTSKNNNPTITLYDANLKKVQDFKTKDNNPNISTAAIYLNNYFMLNGKQLFEMSSGQYKYDVNNLSRSYQSYMINLTINNDRANISVKLDDTEIGSIENVDLVKFLQTENNGIKVSKEYFILSIGDKNLIIKK